MNDRLSESWKTHDPSFAVAPPAGSRVELAVASQLRAGATPVPGYVLVEFLGEGAAGQVWKATGPGGVKAALKFVRLSERISEAELRALEFIKNLDDHPNVMSVRGIWEIDGYLVIAMSLGDRTLLDRLTEARGQGLVGIPADELLEYMADAARGIDFLGEHHILHRDIKPQNILMVAGRGIKIADFGLAKLQEKTLATTSGSMTPAYAPPEFFAGQSSSRSDQYSLAVSYCQLRKSRMPFEGPISEIVAGHLHGKPNLSYLEGGERDVVARALAKNPDERWPDCRSFVKALGSCVEITSSERGGSPEQALTPTLGAASFRTTADTVRPPSKVRSLVGICFVVVAIVASAAFLAWLVPSPTDPLIEMRKREIARKIEMNRPTPTMASQTRAEDYREVEKLEPVDYKDFSILDDYRIVDLRNWKQVPDADFHEMSSAVVATDWIRVKRTGPSTHFDRDEKTSGRDIFFNNLTPLPSKVIGQKSEIMVGADRVKVRRLSIDMSSVPLDSEYEVRYSSTRWNSLQTESELWHGIEGYAGSFKVTLLIVFPENKPFTSHRLMTSPKGRGEVVPFDGEKILLTGDDRKWIYWEVPYPEPGQVYRLHWTW